MVNPNRQLSILEHTAWLRISGEQRFQFLQNQLTCDMNTITSQYSRFAAHCSPKGRVIASFRIVNDGESYLLCLPQSMLDVTYQAFNKYAPLYKIEIEHEHNIKRLGIIGVDCLKQLVDNVPQNPNETSHQNQLTVIQISSYPRYEIWGPQQTIDSLHEQMGTQYESADETYWRYLNIKERIARIYPQTSEKLIPHRLGYQHIGAIDFNKGCYIGQEIIARTHHRSKKTFHLSTLTTDTAYNIGDNITPQTGKQGLILECVPFGRQYELLIGH